MGWGRRRGGRGMVAVESCRIERCFGPDCSGGSSQCAITGNMLYPFSFVLVMFTSTSTRKGITQPSFTDTINDLRPMQVQ